MTLSAIHIRQAVLTALQEDLGTGDITTESLFPTAIWARAEIRAQEPVTLAGVSLAKYVFRELDPHVRFPRSREDGDTVRRNAVILTCVGDARALLQGERTALNFLQHLSGIATLTTKVCKQVKGYRTTILDTRKTTPGLRVLEKWAARLGGAHNHRRTLSDGMMIKDNHLALLRGRLSIEQACRLARQRGPHGHRISIEAESLRQVREALRGGADIILLDNMTPDMVKEAVALVRGRALIEVSGGVTIENVREFAQAGANFISIGMLTHSAPAVNISMHMVPLRTHG